MQKELKVFIDKFRAFLSEKLKEHSQKLPYFIDAIISLLIVVFGIKLFVELTENLKTEVLAEFDTSIAQYFTSIRTPFLTKYFVIVTDIGDVWGYLGVFLLCTLLFYFYFKGWKYVIQLASVLVLALSSNLILKEIINRERPTLAHLVTVKTLSYPSGHAMTAMAFYGFLIYLITTFKIRIFYKIGLILVLVILILSIGISRIYLGVHFPSDIAGGFIAGFIWVIFCVLILNLIKIFKRDSKT